MRPVLRQNLVRHSLGLFIKEHSNKFTMNVQKCARCEYDGLLQETEYGSLVCPYCGVELFSYILRTYVTNRYCVPLKSTATYTRIKRFKKYLNRATCCQSQNSIPENTWEYLLRHAPYKNPGAIVRQLKKAPKKIRKKCYDSLPMLVHHLCPDCTVPRLCEREKQQALYAFRKLDQAYRQGEQFISYLYALEYILGLIGRHDILPFINKISCRVRASSPESFCSYCGLSPKATASI